MADVRFRIEAVPKSLSFASLDVIAGKLHHVETESMGIGLPESRGGLALHRSKVETTGSWTATIGLAK